MLEEVDLLAGLLYDYFFENHSKMEAVAWLTGSYDSQLHQSSSMCNSSDLTISLFFPIFRAI